MSVRVGQGVASDAGELVADRGYPQILVAITVGNELFWFVWPKIHCRVSFIWGMVVSLVAESEGIRQVLKSSAWLIAGAVLATAGVAQAQEAEREIAEIVDVRLGDLIGPGGHDKMIDRFPTWQKAEQISYYRIGAHRLWGLSYRILQPIIPRLVGGDWNV